MKSRVLIFLFSIKMQERAEQSQDLTPVNKKSLLFRKPFMAN